VENSLKIAFRESVAGAIQSIETQAEPRLEYNSWLPQGQGMWVSPGDHIIVTNRLVRRIIEPAISKHGYDPNVKAKQLDLRALDDVIKWDDAIRGA
jgi:hypothetical protein